MPKRSLASAVQARTVVVLVERVEKRRLQPVTAVRPKKADLLLALQFLVEAMAVNLMLRLAMAVTGVAVVRPRLAAMAAVVVRPQVNLDQAEPVATKAVWMV